MALGLMLAEAKKNLASDYHLREGVIPQKSMISYMHNVLHI
jgi:hypothetical protein